MSYAGDDLVPLLLPTQSETIGFRQGVIVSYDQTTGANTVMVGGTTMTDLPILNTSEALLMTSGAVVGILAVGANAKTMFILGRIAIPGTADALTALAMVSNRIQAAEVLGTQSTSSTTFQTLSGPVVSDVPISSSGKALVLVGAAVNYGTTSSANTEGGWISYSVSGATTVAASASHSAQESLNINATTTVNGQLVRAIVQDGLNPGLHTFTHQIRAETAGRSCNFDRRSLVIFAL